jgi:hypothetical protein
VDEILIYDLFLLDVDWTVLSGKIIPEELIPEIYPL